ncbi:MAG: glycoside hydrolase family 3 C-terminal domain-containing protein [Prolixibacteraceae bacterium]|nr:glycoside hydrolase family 3 C-terminal domain-containing protein [Prolixibacteraceae bacterium]
MKLTIQLSLIFFLLMLVNACVQQEEKDPVEQQVSSLLAQMTLDEKLGQMMQVNYYGKPEDWNEQLKNGQIGSFLNLSGVIDANEVQRIAMEESRLGIPLLIGRDVIHGFKTIFPIPLGMASSWSTEMAEGAMEIAAKEAKAAGINWTFAPMIDVTWDPRWGRVAETCGEDPYLTSQLGVAMIRGYQGNNPSDSLRIAACAKHYVGYGMSEAGRDYNTTYIPEALLRNVHLRPFKAAADAGCLTFMSAFNDLNGVPTSGNYFTLKTILRDEWKYDGMVVSDWASIQQQVVHGYCETDKDAAEKSVLATVDMEMASRCYDHLKQLIEEGKITEELINERVANILRIKFKMGLFENPYVDETLAERVTLTDENLDYARKVARNSMVLLKNEAQTLPLKKTQKVALIGPMTNAPHDQMGTWVFDGDEKNSITPLTAFQEVLGSNLNYALGLEYSRDKSRAGFTQALAAARKSDVVVYLVGEEAGLSGEANSRGIIDLPGLQSELLSELSKTGKPIVLVVLAGRPLGIGAEIDLSDAVLYAWHPGTMAGPALTDLIFGDYSPSAKLPITMVKGAGQIPFYYYRKNTGKPTDPERMTYIDDIPRNSKQLSLGFTSLHIDYGVTPLYPFGYGLSYTTFDYSEVSLSSSELMMKGDLTASCTITNIGSVAAEEIVQLYVRDLVGSLTRPIKELKGFTRIALQPGESKEVTFTIQPSDLEFHNGEAYVIEPGKFRLWIAKDSESGIASEFTLLNEQK